MPISKPVTLTSAANPMLKEIRRAVQRGTVTRDGFCVAETFHLLEEALRSECEVHVVLCAESVRSAVESHVAGLNRIRVAVLPDDLFRAISGTEASQGVMALVRPPAWTLDQVFRGQSLTCVLDGIQDPGNAGTIIRSAEAFGATGLIFLKGTVSPYNPKAVRGSAGSIFRLPLVSGVEPHLARAAIEQHRLDLYTAMPSGERTIIETDLNRRCAFVVGSEGHGVSETFRAGSAGVRIPTARVESLNAAVAASIFLYEARRQRMMRG